MRLDLFLLADAAETHNGKLSVLGGGITRVTVQVLPYVIPILTVVARFRADDIEDLSTPHTATLTLIEPGGDVVFEIGGINLRSESVGQVLPGEEIYSTLVMQFGGVVLATEGVYRIVFRVDDEVAREMSLPVVRARVD